MGVARTAFELLVPRLPAEHLEDAHDGVDNGHEVGHVDFEHHDEDEVDPDREQRLQHPALDDQLEQIEEDLEDGVGGVEEEDGGRREDLVPDGEEHVERARPHDDGLRGEPVQDADEVARFERRRVEIGLARELGEAARGGRAERDRPFLGQRIAALEARVVGVEAAAPRRRRDGGRVAHEASVRQVARLDEAGVLLAEEDEREYLEDQRDGRLDDVVRDSVPQRDDGGVEDVRHCVVDDAEEVPRDLGEVQNERGDVEGALRVICRPKEQLVDQKHGEQHA